MHQFLILFLLFVLVFSLRLVYSTIWVPLKLEVHLRRQGIGGRKYRPFVGNTREIRELARDAMSKPMPNFGHDILYRVDPMYHVWSALHGKTFLFWFGTKARLTVAGPEMIKEILLNSSGAFERLDQNPLTKHLLGDGLFRLKGRKWAQHRRIISPAFNIERVKQGIGGHKYHPYVGNTKEIQELAKDVMSKLILYFNHAILYRADPMYHMWSTLHRKTFFFSFGTKARLTVARPEMIKEILLNPSSTFKRLDQNPPTKHLLGDGLFRLRGRKWVKHTLSDGYVPSPFQVSVFLNRYSQYRCLGS